MTSSVGELRTRGFLVLLHFTFGGLLTLTISTWLSLAGLAPTSAQVRRGGVRGRGRCLSGKHRVGISSLSVRLLQLSQFSSKQGGALKWRMEEIHLLVLINRRNCSRQISIAIKQCSMLLCTAHHENWKAATISSLV